MQRRHPIAWDCTTDEVREKFYNGMAEELDWTWKEIKRLRDLLRRCKPAIEENADTFGQGSPSDSLLKQINEMLVPYEQQ